MSNVTRRQMLRTVAVFALLPFLIGVLLFARMKTVLNSYTVDYVETQAKSLTELASQRLSSRTDELERVAGYLRNGVVEEERMGEVAERLLPNVNNTLLGIVRLGGSAVSGQSMPPSEYPAIQNAFRGNSTARYRQDEGIMFAAPIYNEDRIKYVLYELFDDDALLKGFGTNYFDGKATYMLADDAQQVVIPGYEQAVVKVDGVQMSFSRLAADMMRSGFGAQHLNVSGGDDIYFFASELEQPNIFLFGVIPYKAVVRELMSLFGVVSMVFLILMVLFCIGTIQIVRTDAKAREGDELRRAKESVEAAYSSKSRFLANMSHELRTPLNAIMGMDEMILRQSTDTFIREWAMDIKSASQILLALINDVLDFTKIESGMLTIQPGEYKLVSMIRELNLLSENRARAKSLEFELDIQPELPMELIGDDLRLQQILTNLLTNALKYTRYGSVTLHISQRSREGDKIVLHCAVIDTGSGIKSEDIEKLMKVTPFTRVDENRNRNVEGSGLGLPIIINLLRLMGSELKVESVYGKGSTFWFDVEQKVLDDTPIGNIRDRLEDEVKEYAHSTSLYAPRARVMVVDDNAFNRKIFVNLLMDTKIQVTPVSSGAKCLQLVQQEHFDLIFMDHLMPEMDGMETLRRLKQLPDNLCKDTPVIALTANVYNGAQEQYVALGFDAFLAKPIASDKLENLLMKMLPSEYLEEPPADLKTKSSEITQDLAAKEELPEIDGVNWGFAQLNIKDSQLLWDALCDFYESLDGEMSEITELAADISDEASLKNYRTRVHALKSTSALVGILSVSELARLLEGFASEGDRDRIKFLTPVLIELLEKTRERIRPFMAEKHEKKAMTDSASALSLLETLRTVLDSMDIITADAVMAELNRFFYDDNIQAGIDELSDCVARVDFEGAEAVLERVLSLPEWNNA